jgi:hypothetical protein
VQTIPHKRGVLHLATCNFHLIAGKQRVHARSLASPATASAALAAASTSGSSRPRLTSHPLRTLRRYARQAWDQASARECRGLIITAIRSGVLPRSSPQEAIREMVALRGGERAPTAIMS